MWVCACTYVSCVRVCIHICVYIHVCVHVCIVLSMNALLDHGYRYLYMYICACMHVCAYVYACTLLVSGFSGENPDQHSSSHDGKSEAKAFIHSSDFTVTLPMLYDHHSNGSPTLLTLSSQQGITKLSNKAHRWAGQWHWR